MGDCLLLLLGDRAVGLDVCSVEQTACRTGWLAVEGGQRGEGGDRKSVKVSYRLLALRAGPYKAGSPQLHHRIALEGHVETVSHEFSVTIGI